MDANESWGRIHSAVEPDGDLIDEAETVVGESPRRLVTLLDSLMLVAFLFSVVVQLNDPDPLPWIAIYGSAVVACALTMSGRGHWAFPAIIAALAAAWTSRIAPRVVGQVRFGDMFGAFEMESVAIEEAREACGLLIIATWMVVLAVRRWRATPSPG